MVEIHTKSRSVAIYSYLIEYTPPSEAAVIPERLVIPIQIFAMEDIWSGTNEARGERNHLPGTGGERFWMLGNDDVDDNIDNIK